MAIYERYRQRTDHNESQDESEEHHEQDSHLVLDRTVAEEG